MKELIKRNESIEHLKHFGRKDPNLLIYNAYIESGRPFKARRFLEYRNKWEEAVLARETAPFPYFVIFGLSNSCNLSCAHCYRTFNKDRTKKSSLGYDQVAKLLNECKEAGVYSVALGTESEAFVYKRIADAVRLIARKDFIDTWICTNGTLLNDAYIDLILDSNITRLTISIDAATEETYRKVRGGNFRGLLSNIFSFLDKRAERKMRLPVLRVTFVKYNLNEGEADKFIDFWAGIADEVDIQPLIDIKNVDELRYNDIKKIKCAYPQRMLYINWNGDYKPCCSEFCKYLTIGNIKDMRILEAWHSQYIRGLRLQLSGKERINKVCLNCLRSLHSKEKYSPLKIK